MFDDITAICGTGISGTKSLEGHSQLAESAQLGPFPGAQETQWQSSEGKGLERARYRSGDAESATWSNTFLPIVFA